MQQKYIYNTIFLFCWVQTYIYSCESITAYSWEYKEHVDCWIASSCLSIVHAGSLSQCHGLPRHLNRPLMLLVTLALFLAWQVKMSAVEIKVCMRPISWEMFLYSLCGSYCIVRQRWHDDAIHVYECEIENWTLFLCLCLCKWLMWLIQFFHH